MLAIYTTEDILTSIYQDHEHKYDGWYEFISKVRPTLNVLLKEGSDYDYNDYNPVIQFSQNFDFHVDPEYAEDGESYLSKVSTLSIDDISNPYSIFILDVDKETAKLVSDKYGVVCHPFEVPPSNCPLFQEGIEISVDNDEMNRGWHELVASDVTMPSNSIIFSDRYLFSSDKLCKATADDGIENIFEILDHALPQRLGTCFHILFVYDASTLDSCLSIGELASKLEILRKRLKRPYDLLIEAVSISKNDFNYKEDYHYSATHNRRILSNYYIIRADHSLKAFKGGRSLYTQSLGLDWVASKGVVRQCRSDTPAKSLYKYIKGIKAAISKLKSYNRVFSFCQNGDSSIALANISNRLLQ